MFLIYMTYLLFGSLCFVSLETSQEMEKLQEAAETVRLARDMVNVLRKHNYTDEVIHEVFDHEYRQFSQGVDPASLGWRQMFGDKIFFAFILITTVGYGNVAPKSMLGQIFCVFYTMLGLPIHVIMMRLLSFKFRGAMRKMFKFAQDKWSESKFSLFAVGTGYMTFWSAIFLFIPTAIFMLSEEWNYMQGLYFSYVSLTTIGLGDFVAGVSDRHYEDQLYSLNVFGMLMWMFFGLGFVTMAITLLSYLMGVVMLDKLDCKCQKRTEAMGRLKPILDLFKELNWQLVKCKPEDFTRWEEIENFKNFLAENPQDVTLEMLQKMFEVVVELKEKAYDHVSRMQQTVIPMSPIIKQARDNLPDFLAKESTTVTFSSDVPEDDSRPRLKPSKSISVITVQNRSSFSAAEAPPRLSRERSRNSADRPQRKCSLTHRGLLKRSSSSIDLPSAEDKDNRSNDEEGTRYFRFGPSKSQENAGSDDFGPTENDDSGAETDDDKQE